MTPKEFFELTLPQYNALEQALERANKHESDALRSLAL